MKARDDRNKEIYGLKGKCKECRSFWKLWMGWKEKIEEDY